MVLLAGEGFQVFSPVVSFISGEFLWRERVDFLLLLQQRPELAAIRGVGRGGCHFSDNAAFFLHDNVGLVARPLGARLLPRPGIRIHRADQFVLGMLSPIRNRLFQQRQVLLEFLGWLDLLGL